jgi:hypothetical protein
MRSAGLLLVATLATLATLASCSRTARFEVGVRTTLDGERILRVGASFGFAGSSISGDFSLSESVGYRWAGGHNATFTTRAMWGVGPVYVSGAFDIDDDLGVDLAPALAVPLYRESEETRGGGGLNLVSAGLQLRLGRHDGETTAGADFVVGWDELDWIGFGP